MENDEEQIQHELVIEDEIQGVEEDNDDEGAEEEEIETGETQTLGEDVDGTQSKTSEKKVGTKARAPAKPKPVVVREQGKTLLPLARVQRIMKADKVSRFLSTGFLSSDLDTSNSLLAQRKLPS